jgi:hypothetical protein
MDSSIPASNWAAIKPQSFTVEDKDTNFALVSQCEEVPRYCGFAVLLLGAIADARMPLD